MFKKHAVKITVVDANEEKSNEEALAPVNHYAHASVLAGNVAEGVSLVIATYFICDILRGTVVHMLVTKVK